jgi:Transposase IS4
MADTRRVVGGSCWAKAESVSHDAKRVYGGKSESTWLKGTVLEVISRRPEGAKRSVNYVKASYMVGNAEKVKILSLQVLKAKDPSPPPPTPPPATPVATAPTGTPAAANDATPALATPPAAGTPATPAGTPVATVNEAEWHEGDVFLETNGPFTQKTWKFVDQYDGREYTPGCDVNKEFTPYDYFMAVFPKNQLSQMYALTNQKIRQHNDSITELSGLKKEALTTPGEILRWFGVCILMTRYEFGDRASLWSKVPPTKYIQAPDFGAKTRMSRDRFDFLMRNMSWSDQPEVRPEHMSSEEYRWCMVEDFVDNYNEHRKTYYNPSWQLCVDETIGRWYGLGGNWINEGLPHYVSIERKPEDGFEIQDCCDAMSGIMLRLRLVKSATAESNLYQE